MHATPPSFSRTLSLVWVISVRDHPYVYLQARIRYTLECQERRTADWEPIWIFTSAHSLHLMQVQRDHLYVRCRVWRWHCIRMLLIGPANKASRTIFVPGGAVDERNGR